MVLRFIDLNRAVAELLQLTFCEDHYEDKGRAIVKAIFKVMTEALQRGERIHIPGLGVFKIKTTKSRTMSVAVYRHTKGQVPKYEKRRNIIVPAKKYVFFKPDAGIQRSVLERYRNETQPRTALVLLRAHSRKAL